MEVRNGISVYSGGITTNSLTSTGLITARGGVGSTHIYYTTTPTTNMYSIGYRSHRQNIPLLGNNLGTQNGYYNIYTLASGGEGTIPGIWLYEVQVGPKIAITTNTPVRLSVSESGTTHSDQTISMQFSSSNVISAANAYRLICTKYITTPIPMYLIVSANHANFPVSNFRMDLTLTRLA
jgi:hypothetical protein